MITKEHTQEALSNAYVHALAGSAGLNLAARTVFDYGVDGIFHPIKIVDGERIQTGFPVEFQMKATTVWKHEGTFVVYDLDARAHRLLTDREPGQALAILILLCLPLDAGNWLEGCEDYLLLKNCCYWFRPDGPPTTNVSSIRIRIPRSQVLTPDSLKSIMAVARQEGLAT
ncbi:DUF4365 domain-containing protein [Terrihabitans soli]|uniref:DUF4365 domain-containing protein n=1 Tax=Terrihabitans soli TaxID=708113 RepID=UPI001CA33271